MRTLQEHYDFLQAENADLQRMTDAQAHALDVLNQAIEAMDQVNALQVELLARALARRDRLVAEQVH